MPNSTLCGAINSAAEPHCHKRIADSLCIAGRTVFCDTSMYATNSGWKTSAVTPMISSTIA